MIDVMIKKYPELTPYEDFTLRDDGGGVYIDVWKSEKPKPSPADLKAWGEDESFQQAKADKYAELDRACREAITNTRFTATIGGVAYDFSYDTEAQGRLKGTPFLLSEGIAPSVPWNAYVNGQRTTVPINLADFKVLAAEAYKHEMKYVIKFREILVYWQTAKTLEDLKAISWN